VSSPVRNKRLRIAPQVIIAVIAIAFGIYILFEILEDVLIEGAPLTSGPLIGAIVSITQNVPGTVQSWGYAGVFGLMLLESSSLPIPSEVVLPFAGFLVFQGNMDFWVVIVVATAAGVIGSLIDYFIGLKGVHVLMQHKVLGKVLFSTKQLEIAAGWFNKRGSIMVFIGRLIPGFRTLISFPAGAVKMPMTKFLVYTTVGCLIWNTLLIGVGYYLGSQWRAVAGVLHYVIIAAVVVVIAAFAAYMLHKRRIDKKVSE
jgi:membrane protein DedA with SNARE-associated domain